MIHGTCLSTLSLSLSISRGMVTDPEWPCSMKECLLKPVVKSSFSITGDHWISLEVVQLRGPGRLRLHNIPQQQ